MADPDQLQQFLARLRDLSDADWHQVITSYLGPATGTRYLGSGIQSEGVITSYQRHSAAGAALERSFKAVREAAGPGPLSTEWRTVANASARMACALVVASHLKTWEMASLAAPFASVVGRSKGSLQTVTVDEFCSALRGLTLAQRDQVIRDLGSQRAAALAASEAVAEGKIANDTNSAQALARGATIAAGQRLVQIETVQGAAQAAVTSLLARSKLSHADFESLWMPFASVIPSASLGGTPVQVGQVAGSSGCVIASALLVILPLLVGFGVALMVAGA